MEELEGIGTMGMRVFYSGQLASVQDQLDEVEGPLPDPSLLEILRWKVGLALRTFLGRLTCRNGRARANLKPEV